MDPRFAASAICRFRDLPLPRFAASAIWAASGAKRLARNAVWAGMLVGARATIRASGRRARGKASGWRLPGFWCGPGFWWFVARSGRCLARSAWRVTRCGLVCRSVRAPPYAPADGARAVGLLAGVCPASDADRASGGFWRVLGGLARYGRDRGGPGVRAPDVTPYPQSQVISPVRA